MIASFVVFCVIGGIVGAQQHFCGDFHPQMIVNFNQILGRWYATEILFHEKEENEIIKYHNVCPIILLSDVSTPPEDLKHNIQEENNLNELMKPLVDLWNTNQNTTKRRWSLAIEQDDLNKFKNLTLKNLRILWHEHGLKNEYSLKYNTSRPGYWMSFGPLDNNSFTDQFKHQHQHHFVGTVQVLRAVRTHMVLTFCHISQRDQFFSVVLTREPWMDTRELQSVHNFLQRKLPIKHIRRMCMDYIGNGGKTLENMTILILAYLLFVNRFVFYLF